MKAIELKHLILKTAEEHDGVPLSEAEARFLASMHLAALAFEDETRLGHPVPERRCLICGVLVSQCCC
jgi:hypothetical protein